MTAVATPDTSTPERTVERTAEPILDTFTGLGKLLRLVLRRDRLRIGLWFTGIVGLVVATAASITGLYDTQAELDQYGALVQDNAALIVQAGPGYGMTNPTTGSVMMNEVGIWTIIAVALMSVFMVVRHTRNEEESERVELIRAAPVGRHAPMAAALIAVMIVNVLVAVGVVVSLVAYDLASVGSLAFGATLIGAGAVSGSIGALTSQVSSTARSAIGLGCVFVAVAFVLRAVGDVGDGRLSWLSPIGWAQAIRAFADERWWVLLLPFVASIVVIVAAVELQSHRDIGAGILPQKPGPPHGNHWLASPLGLAVRLQRGSLIGWSVGLGIFGFFYGVVSEQADSIIEDNPDMEDFFAQLGQASPTDAFLSTSVLMVALIGTGFTISSVLRLRSEEIAGHADWVLATPSSRREWTHSHLAMTIGGTTVLMAVSGAAIGAGFAMMTGDLGRILHLFAAAIVMVPAMLVVAGLAMVIYGVWPKLAQLSWGALVGVCVVGILGPLLKLPPSLMNLSPFQHVPPMPARSFEPLPVLVLCLAAALFLSIGRGAVERRDIG